MHCSSFSVTFVFNTLYSRSSTQVGVQCEVEPETGASALEDKVNSILPLMNKEGEEEE
jgi:hypothetical protein